MNDSHPRAGKLPSFSSIFDALPAGLQVFDRDLRYVYVNPQAATDGRTSPEALVGNTLTDCYPGIERTAMFAALRRCLVESRPCVVEHAFTDADGKPVWFEQRMQPIPDGVIVLSIGVTARRQAQEELRHLQRVATIGRLAAGAAHEFNNLLSVMLMLGEAALARAEAPAREDLADIVFAARRAAEVARQLLVMGAKEATPKGLVDPVEVVRGLGPLLEPVVGPRIRLEFDIESDAGHVRMDPAQLEQLVTNLVLNARDAISEGGRIVVRVATAPRERLPADRADIRHVALTVGDDGAGMDEETSKRIFEPFFTTKGRGRGTGLGLSTVLGIVEQCRGTIAVDTRRGVGTTVHVHLPCARASPQTFGP
jgi:two-component system cell cycle sensor histidine kinase/response regulator CckA